MTIPELERYDHCRLDRLLPHQIRECLAENPTIYIPLGTVEWHSEHLPIGLDALTAEGLCLRVANRIGGLVYPVLHYGTGGGHGAYPWTVMLSDHDSLERMLRFTLTRLSEFGVRKALLFSGHFPDEQLAMIDRLAADWSAANSAMHVVASAVNRIPGLDLAPDHAGLFETTLLYGLHPELVAENRLPQKKSGETEADPYGAQRHEPRHPLWGIFGPDPRGFDKTKAQPLVEAIIGHLVGLMV
ncbi:MAG: creatininase family protein [Rhizobiaceae bacterium]